MKRMKKIRKKGNRKMVPLNFSYYLAFCLLKCINYCVNNWLSFAVHLFTQVSFCTLSPLSILSGNIKEFIRHNQLKTLFLQNSFLQNMLTMKSKSGKFCPSTVKIFKSFWKQLPEIWLPFPMKKYNFWLFQDHEYGYLKMHTKTKRKLAQTIVLIVAVKV